MIRVRLFRRSDGTISGFHITGHAGYDRAGRDIICAAVSAVAYTALGYMDRVLMEDQGRRLYFTEKDGDMSWQRYEGENAIADIRKQEVDAVLEAMLVGFEQIRGSYGKRYLNVTSQEVR